MRLVMRLHDDGWLLTLAVMALVLIGGIWSLWRASVMEGELRSARVVLIRVDEMLQDRTQFFRRIESNQAKIMNDIAAMLTDQNQKFARILEHVRHEEDKLKRTQGN